VAADKVSRGGLLVDAGRVGWTEGRPDDGGRSVVVLADPGTTDPPTDRSPAGVGVRSRVHEYGGAAAVLSDGVLYYVDQDDQAWYRLDPGDGAVPRRLGGEVGDGPVARHGDGTLTPDGRWLLSVEERVAPEGTTHRVVAAATDGSGTSAVVVDDGDFVAAPRPSPDGRWLAWITWDHPDMPWDGSRLRVAPLAPGDDHPVAGTAVTLAGGPGVSVGQPRWAADGSLFFVDDRSGWWLPYRVPGAAVAGAGPRAEDAVPLVGPGAEFHAPDWVLGQHTLAELADGSLAARRSSEGRDTLVVLRPPPEGPDATGWVATEVAQPCVSLAGVVSPDGRTVVVVGSTPTEAQVVLRIEPDGGRWRRLSVPSPVAVTPDRASPAAPRSVTSGGRRIPGQFFAPVNPDVVAPDGPPPLVVFCHGGPTSAAPAGYDPVVQFLTSRGIAVAAVDYRGSTGYGRTYRDALRGAWGVADVDDCVAYARALADDGLVDGGRMAIRGTSAGGFTALAALVRARCFVGAVAWYGVTDLVALAADTHDFESRYLDGLVGPLPAAAATYRSRSPLHHAHELAGRVLLLQGSDDPIVPLGQAESFAAELQAGGADCRLVVFDGESHGFRRADTIGAALSAELDFYRELFAPGGPDGG
jgi:dipeptidyl aminopeptidase/acylaminoacyl peptidase